MAPPTKNTQEWERFLSGTDPLLRLGRSVFRHLPSPPRCKLCLAPFAGIGRPLMALIGKVPWERNPRVCRFCAAWLRRKGPGGAEVDATLVFADVRGSTALAERMSPADYAALIGRFFETATNAFVQEGAIIDQLVGDAAVGLFLPGYAGSAHARAAIDAASALLVATGHDREPWLPIGVGVHCGLTFIGSVGAEDSFTDFTALGDPVNTAARLASAARAGEVLVSDAACRQAGLASRDFELRSLELKGKAEPVHAVVLTPALIRESRSAVQRAAETDHRRGGAT
jgi:adenylate cyclase